MASTVLSTENANGKIPPNSKSLAKQTSELTRHGHNENRRTLQTLQYSTGAPISPIRKIVKPQKKSLIQKSQKPITVFVDPPQKKLDDKASQTEKVQNSSEAYNLLVSEEVPEVYWKDLAEERRKALDESLHENEMLHKEVAELKEQNEKLSKVASQAEYFADVLKDVLGADEENEDQNSNSEDNVSCNDCETSDDNEYLKTDQLLQDNCDSSPVKTSDQTENDEAEEDTNHSKETSQQDEENPKILEESPTSSTKGSLNCQ